MSVSSARLIYFSPTGTTRKVLEGIADGIQLASVEHLDLTPPDAAARKPAELHGKLAIIGSPVYAGRLPDDMISRLKRVKGNGEPAAIVVVFGNRAYDDALLELRDVARETGFKPFAAGAFIGEHSFSTGATPIAIGRPDGEDLQKAGEFGKMIREKMKNLQRLDDMAPFPVPGKFPYKERTALSNISPVTHESLCAKCENCASVCPTAAITMKDTVVTDPGACIRCCACVKTCSTGARTMEDARIRQVAEQLSMNCRNRKEPELFI